MPYTRIGVAGLLLHVTHGARLLQDVMFRAVILPHPVLIFFHLLVDFPSIHFYNQIVVKIDFTI